MSRAPQPQVPARPSTRNNGDISNNRNSSDVSLIRLRTTGDVSLHYVAGDVSQQDRENNSENSYKTATSELESLIPKQVSECYRKPSNETCALERKTSVRAIQEQQYRSLGSSGPFRPGSEENQK